MKNSDFIILSILKERLYLLIMAVVALLFFGVNYYIMVTSIGSRDNMCVIGGALTWKNIIFSAILSALIGIMVAGTVKFISTKFISTRKINLGSTSFLSLGAVIGEFTLFCTLCTLPVISIAGLSLGLSFFTVYNNTFKVISLFLVLLSIYMLNKKLNHECIYSCDIPKKITKSKK